MGKPKLMRQDSTPKAGEGSIVIVGNGSTDSRPVDENITKQTPSVKKRGRKKKIKPETNSVTSITTGVNKILIKRDTPSSAIAQLPDFFPLDTKLRSSGKTADWDDFLSVGYNLHFLPPVTCFRHAPLVDIWKDLAVVGLKIEIANPFVRCSRPVNWVATIKHFAGYKALVEFECFDTTPRHAAWMSFCSDVPKHLGYSDKNRILLHPPHSVRANHSDFLDKARETVLNCDTVSVDHADIIKTHIEKTQKHPLLTMLEVMDRDHASRMRVATVTATIGNRIHVTYVIEPRKDDIGYWFDVNSDYVHPIGWSQAVGHEIYGVTNSTKFTPLNPDYFPSYPSNLVICQGQMLEARHPLRPYQMCAASVFRVLNYGYFVAIFRTIAKEQDSSIVFTFHVSSPFVFPCGFCEKNRISLVPPFGESRETFVWTNYLERRKLQPAPLHLIPERMPHSFKPGMKIEACGILDPTYLGPGTIRKTRSHLLYVSLDGWPRTGLSGDSDTEFWTHAESSEIYPIGFAEMVGHNFQGRVEANSLRDVDEQFNTA